MIRNIADPTVLIPIEQITPAFTTVDLRSYYNLTETSSFVMGIENLFDENYLEHLDLRLNPQDGTTAGLPSVPAEQVLAPGLTFYAGFELTR